MPELTDKPGGPSGPNRWLLRLLVPVVAIALYGLVPADPLLKGTLALMLWMLGWWILELAPFPVTALLPLLWLPGLGLLELKQVTPAYSDPVIFLFLSGFLLAIALEKHQLHRIFSQLLLRYLARSANSVVFVLMLATSLISMWISNTATAVMMLPIAAGLLKSLLDQQPACDPKSARNLALCLNLGIAHAANIGGSATLIGTPPNVVMAGYLQELAGIELGFGRWMLFATPVCGLLLLASWWLMTQVLFPFSFSGPWNSVSETGGPRLQLDSVQRLVVWIFGLTAAGWIGKPWLEWLIGRNLHDAHIGLAGGMLLFLVPAGRGGPTPLQWEDTRRLPWGILLLFGGGIAVASSMEQAGIIASIGDYAQQLGELPVWLFILIFAAVALFMTEIMSNVALATVLLPVVIATALGLNWPPLLLVAPVAMATSYAFMLPISTPPNAIVYSSGRIPQTAMLWSGWWLNLIAILVVTVAASLFLR